MATRWQRLLLVALAAIMAAGFGVGGALRAQAAGDIVVSQTQTTTSYKVDLDIGPLARLMTQDQAKGATTGEVLADVSQPTPESIREAIMPADHYIAVHLHSNATGAMMSSPVPVVTVRSLATGKTYIVDELLPMYDVAQGQPDLHFGRNIYLPAGDYRVAVWVGRDRTVFTISVSGDYVHGQMRG